jgi:Zn finger protein HypA/HybF involved in hydrogenase expression
MHEFSICRQIIFEAKKHGMPLAITVEVGELANMTPRHLKEHLSEYVKWKINVRSRKGRIACRCGYKGSPVIKDRGHDFVLIECPKCKGSDFSSVIGDKIILKSVRVK